MTTTARKAKKKSGKATVLESRNPRTGELLAEIPAIDPAEVSEVVARARKVQPEWAAIPPAARARYLDEVRHRMHDRIDDLIEVVAGETGKPWREALILEAFPSATLLARMGSMAPKALKSRAAGGLAGPLLFGSRSRIEWRPFGVVGAITPWNYPITNAFLGFLGALVAGNAVVLKPSEVTPASGELIRDLFDPLPPDVFNVIQGGADVGAALVDAPCDKISFIGSAATGRKILAAAAKHLTPAVMELGGQDAAIVCEDADLDVASSGLAWSSFFNAGQTCCSVERIFVADSVADEFQERLLQKVSQIQVGGRGIEMGPMTFAPQLDTVGRHVKDAVAKGATVLAGGTDAGPKNKGGTLWFAPTVLTDVTTDMDVVREESFGPVITITRVRDEDEAVRRANEEGVILTASVWTSSKPRADFLFSQIRAGAMQSNDHGILAGMGWAPWGGLGESGFGRLNGILGIQEFAVPVHVAHSLSGKMKKPYWYPYDDDQEVLVRGLAKLMAAKGAATKLSGAGAVLKTIGKVLKSRL